MKGFFCGLLKVVLSLLALGAAVYAVVTYWDKIIELLDRAKKKLAEAKSSCCGSEYDDYADWEQ